MPKRMTPSQYKSWARQQEQKQRQAIQRYNREVERANRTIKSEQEKVVREINREIDRINQHNQRVINAHKRELRQQSQKRRTAITKYNAAVRSYNARVRRERLQRLAALQSVNSSGFVEVRVSALDLNSQYDRVESSGLDHAEILTAAERESSNSAAVAYALSVDSAPSLESEHEDLDTGILDYLEDLSDDLCDRWRGALFSLNPANADAARQFCTSVREIFTEILSRWAGDRDVIDADPHCELTPQGTPTRRAKIRYLLKTKGVDSPEMLGFVEKDIDDILRLFPIFNKATHGAAGTHSFASLQALKRRVEGGIMFLATIAT